MVKNCHSDSEIEINPQQTQQLRRQADALLRQLIEGREQSQRRLAENGQRDAMKFVTGRSAIEDAIVTTQGMIRDMDELLEQMGADLGHVEPVCQTVAAGNAG